LSEQPKALVKCALGFAGLVVVIGITLGVAEDSVIGAAILWGVISLVVWLVVEGGWGEAIDSGEGIGAALLALAGIAAVLAAVWVIHYLWPRYMINAGRASLGSMLLLGISVGLWGSGRFQRSLASLLGALIVLVCGVFALYGAVALVHFLWRIT